MGGGVCPIRGLGRGEPQSGLDGGGYPIPSQGGTPSQGGGVPQPGLDGGGYPIPGWGGTLARS